MSVQHKLLKTVIVEGLPMKVRLKTGGQAADASVKTFVVHNSAVAEGNVSRIVLPAVAIQWVRWMTMIATGEVLAREAM